MKKLTKRWQLFLYAAAGMGINMLNLMVGSYLCSALLVGGFGKEVIPYQTFAQRDLIIPAVWAVFALAAKIIDGIIDIPMASLTDNLRSRFGRRRPAILTGLILVVAAYLLFLVIPARGATLGNTIYYGIVLCVFYSFYTLTMVTYYATFTEIVETEEKRRTISNVKSVFDIIYFILGYVVVRMLLNGLNIRVVALIVLPLALTMLIPLFMIKEPSTKEGVGEKSETVGLFKSLACTLKNRTFVIWMVVYFFMTFGVQLFLGGINEYFSFVGMNMIFIMMAAFAPVPFTLILYNRLTKKHGFGFAIRYVLITYAAGMLCMFFVGLMQGGTAKTVLSILTGLLSSFAIGAIFSVAYSIPSQLAAEEEQNTGVANSAMYFAVQGLFSGIAAGIATGIVLTALKGSEQQASGAMKYMTLISAIGMLAALALSFLMPRSLTTLGTKKD
ncbi:MAG: MFS transporter [Oscillospiraceae bacterium]|nr:MFS transporter [Oscillospiraceae bacterium]